MSYFNKKQLKTLQKQELNLKRAYKSNFKTHTMQWENDEVAKVYEEATGIKLKDWSCPSCCLNNYKKVGKLYFESVEYYANLPKPTKHPTEETKNIESESNAKKPSSKGTKQKCNA